MNDQITIRTQKLTKHYGDVQALVDLDLDVREGEVFGFLGPSSVARRLRSSSRRASFRC